MNAIELEKEKIDRLDAWYNVKGRSSVFGCPGGKRVQPDKHIAGVYIPLESLSEVINDRAAWMAASVENRALKKSIQRAAIQVLKDVVGTTTRLFGDEVKIFLSQDPEHPKDESVVFCVDSGDAPEVIIKIQKEWNKELRRIAPEQTDLRLLITAQ